jgi:hypothetical protein
VSDLFTDRAHGTLLAQEAGWLPDYNHKFRHINQIIIKIFNSKTICWFYLVNSEAEVKFVVATFQMEMDQPFVLKFI